MVVQLAKKFVVDFVIESEYITFLKTIKEVLWIMKFIYKLVVVLSIVEPFKLYCDNNRTITQVKGSKSY